MIYLISSPLPGEPQTESEGEDDQPALKRLEADIIDSTADKQKPGGGGHVGDLFSEIHLNELRKLEKQLEQVTIPTADAGSCCCLFPSGSTVVRRLSMTKVAADQGSPTAGSGQVRWLRRRRRVPAKESYLIITCRGTIVNFSVFLFSFAISLACR